MEQLASLGSLIPQVVGHAVPSHGKTSLELALGLGMEFFDLRDQHVRSSPYQLNP